MASTPRLAIGTVFADDYRIIGPLAEGGMGSVYRAEQLSTRKPRAIKVVHGRLLDDERSRARFVREATVAASIASEHVVEVIAAGIDRTTELPYLVMELLDGGDLAAVVKHRGHLSVDEVGALLRQLCHGLAAAHAAKVIHRDLKPENIFVAYPLHAGTAFTVKILDFGIAKVAQESKSVATLTGTVGSPLWMAPEQINNEALGSQTDIWALGLLAFWALTGQSYWRTARAERLTVQALFAEQLFRPIEPASVRAREFGMGAAIPPAFDDWFAHCVTRSPSDRFEEAGAAWAAFEQAIDAGLRTERSLLPPKGERWESTSQHLKLVESTLTDASPSASVGIATGFGTTFGGAATISSTSGVESVPSEETPIVREAAGAPPVASPAPARSRRWPWLVAPLVVLAAGAATWWLWPDPTPEQELANVVLPEEPPTATSGPAEPRPDELHGAEGSTPQPPRDPTGEDERIPDLHSLPPPAQDEPTLLLPVRPLPTQPSFSAQALAFAGWSADGARFVIDAQYGDRPDAPINRLRLLQVHDALSGAMLESYLIEREADASIASRDRIARQAAEAEPYDEWELARRRLRLTMLEPRGRPPVGEARIEAAIEVRTAGSEFEITPTDTGASFSWTMNAAPPDDAPMPQLVLQLIDAEGRWHALEVSLGMSPQALWAAREPDASPSYRGTITYQWSPDGRRVVLRTSAAAERVVAPTSTVEARWFVRAVGPQLYLVDGGAGQRRLRRAAWALEQAGMPVAAVDLDHAQVASSRIYVRVRDPRAATLAERIARGLAHDVPSAILPGGGWDAKVVLGTDYAELQPATP